MNNIICYQTVFKRNNTKEVSVDTFFNNPIQIYKEWESHTDEEINDILNQIKNANSKEYRSELKRNNLPAVSLYQSGFMTIDIDGLEDKPEEKQRLIDILKTDSSVYCLQESVSGNLVIFYKFDASEEDYPYLYYKKYLELTLKLEVSIDFLPDYKRLRYVSLGEKYILNENAVTLTELLKVDHMLTPVSKSDKPKPSVTLTNSYTVSRTVHKSE